MALNAFDVEALREERMAGGKETEEGGCAVESNHKKNHHTRSLQAENVREMYPEASEEEFRWRLAEKFSSGSGVTF